MLRTHIRLAEGEEILCKADVSWVAYISALVLLVALMVTGGLSGLLTTDLTLTNKRLIGHRGFIRKKAINVFHKQISVVNVSQGLLGKLFDYGALTIVTTEGAKHVFKGIAQPWYIKQEIEEAVEMTVLGHKLSDFVAGTEV